MEDGDDEAIPPYRHAAGRRPPGWQDRPDGHTHRRLSRQPRDRQLRFCAGGRENPLSGDSRMSDYLELQGKRALVTGGTKGIGEAVVAALREAGVTVLTTARSRPAHLAYADPFGTADVSTTEGCASVVEAVRERLGCLNILVHVVGGSSAPAGGFAMLDDNEWHKALEQNLFAAVRLDRALVPAMVEQGSGVIIHVTSIQSRLPLPD